MIDLIYKLSNLENDIKFSTQKSIIFQAGMIKLCDKQAEFEDNLTQRVEKIENYLRSGNVPRGMNTSTVATTTVQTVATSTIPQGPRMTSGQPKKQNTTPKANIRKHSKVFK